MLTKRLILTTTALFAVVMSGPLSVANAQRGGAMAACRTDIATFCQNVEAGGGKKMKCLMENQSKLSADCATAVQARSDKRADRKTDAAAPSPTAPSSTATGAAAPSGKGRMSACRADLASLCSTVQRGGGARMKCLTENASKVSPACSDAMAARAQRRVDGKGAIKGACREDSRRLCGSVAKGSGGRRACLQQNQAQLSPACAAVIVALPAKPGRAAPGATAPKQP
jgi:Cysteine rich repeat